MGWITRLYVDHPAWFFLVIALPILLGCGIGGFLLVVYGNLKLGEEAAGKLIEAANYATQTVTTVGYGNMQVPSHAERPLKLFSSFYTILSALVWVSMIDRAFGAR